MPPPDSVTSSPGTAGRVMLAPATARGLCDALRISGLLRDMLLPAAASDVVGRGRPRGEVAGIGDWLRDQCGGDAVCRPAEHAAGRLGTLRADAGAASE